MVTLSNTMGVPIEGLEPNEAPRAVSAPSEVLQKTGVFAADRATVTHWSSHEVWSAARSRENCPEVMNCVPVNVTSHRRSLP